MSRRARIQIVAVGRLRPPHEAAGREYERRVDEMLGLRVDEVAAEPLQRGEAVARRREAERIERAVLDRAHRVALAPEGRAPRDSPAFAAWLIRLIEAARPVTFLVGGPSGLDEGLVTGSAERLSLGPLTLPHQLARVVLAEQLYRAACVHRGHPYPH